MALKASISDSGFMEALTHKLVADTPPRMGRPSLGIKGTTVRLSVEVLKRIDALMGKDNLRAKFIRDAVDEKLARDERLSKPKP